MSNSISSVLPTASSGAANFSPAPAPAQNTQPAPQTTNDATDTVVLTEAQQVYQLYNQGQRVPQIAVSLSLPVETVNNYLGITSG